MPLRRPPSLGASYPTSQARSALPSSRFLPFCFPGHVEDVVVDSSTRGTGLGKMMVGQLTDMALAAGCYKILLNCIAACKDVASPRPPGLGLRCAALGLRCTRSAVCPSVYRVAAPQATRAPSLSIGPWPQARRRISGSMRSAATWSRRSRWPSTSTIRRLAAVWVQQGLRGSRSASKACFHMSGLDSLHQAFKICYRIELVYGYICMDAT